MRPAVCALLLASLISILAIAMWPRSERLPELPVGMAEPISGSNPPSGSDPGLAVDARPSRPAAQYERALHHSRESRRLAAERLSKLVKGVRVDFDARIGTPSFIASNQAFLTGANGEGGAVPAERMRTFAHEAHGVVRAFFAEHEALFGHGPDILDSTSVSRDYVTAHNGLRTTVWQQEHFGLRIFEATLLANVTAQGALVNLSSRLLPDPATAAPREHNHGDEAPFTPGISVQQAVKAAGETVGSRFSETSVTVEESIAGPAQFQRLKAPLLLDVSAGLVWLPINEASMRLGWEVIAVDRKRATMFRAIIDADSGEVLVRQSLTESISPASYRVFVGDSPTPMSPGHPTPLNLQPVEVSRQLVTTAALNTTASPEGWIPDGVNETRGNNVDAHLDLDGNNIADTPRPQGVNRVFNPPLNLAQSPGTNRDAAVVNLFYWANRIHDRYYELGFTEAAGNFQQNNFGRGGVANDAVQADAQDGSGVDNATFSTPPDGSPGRMQMFLFSGPNPDRDSAFDAEIIIHEYTHGLTNRLVGGGVGISALQSRGMGEGWSDFYALCLLSEVGDDPHGNYASGAYSSYKLSSAFESNYYYGIRRYPYSTNLARNPLTFRDIDPGKASAHAGIPLSPRHTASNVNPSQVHAQGEVWCATLWEARANLVAKHGSALGNDLALRLVTDGLKLTPANPTFVQARDAILQAELIYSAGANRSELWAAFAKRGLGAGAVAPPSTTTTGVTESFDLPDPIAVSPASVVSASGPIGGPFVSTVNAFVLTNTGESPAVWTATSEAAWLTLGSTTGTIAPGEEATIPIAFNAAATNLAPGSYTAVLRFKNETNGSTQTRSLPLVVEPYFLPIFSETFETAILNPTYWTLSGAGPYRTEIASAHGPRSGVGHLTMDSSGAGIYARNEATVTLNLTGRANLVLRFWAKGFSDEADGPPTTPFIGGADFDGVAVSEDGTTWYEVQPLRSLTGAWEQFTVDLDQAIAAYGLSYTSAFRIRFNHFDNLEIPTDGFAFDDIVVAEILNRRVIVSLPPETVEGSPSVTGTVSVTPVPASPLTVTLASSDPSELSPAATVEIPAGSTSAPFTATLPDDLTIDGTQSVIISAHAETYAPSSATIHVHDNESAQLSLELPPSTTEGAGTITGTLRVSAPPAKNVRVQLAAGESNELILPPFVEITAGETSVPFVMQVVDDSKIDGTVSVGITASVTNWASGAATVSVEDDEVAQLSMEVSTSMREGDDTVFGLIRIPGTLPAALTVNLSSSDTSAFTVPASVVIFPGQVVASFPITAIDNTMKDGTRTAVLHASASGFTPANFPITIHDNELHQVSIEPIAPLQVRNAPTMVRMTARDIAGVVISNFHGSVALSAVQGGSTVPVDPTSVDFTNGAWEGPVRIGVDGSNIRLNVSTGSALLGISNSFAVGRGPLAGFAFDPIPEGVRADAPIPVTVRAVDAGGNRVEEFAGAVNLNAMVRSASEPVGFPYRKSNLGLVNSADAGRIQCIFTPEEMGVKGPLFEILMNIAWVSSNPLRRFTVRMKHTELATFHYQSPWETDDWTTVYQGDFASRGTGWHRIPFAQPFQYDGVRNVMVDISHWTPNFGYGISFLFETTVGSALQCLQSPLNSSTDPLTWSRTYPLGSPSSEKPNLRFVKFEEGMVRPTVTERFVQGKWTGSVSFHGATEEALIVVRDPNSNATGHSNAFVVSDPRLFPGGGILYQENFEAPLLADRWELAGDGKSRMVVTNAGNPKEGQKHLVLDSADSVTNSLCRATWTIDLEGLRGIVLKFWAKGFNEMPNAPPPQPFNDSAAFDGVAISADGVRWFEVQPLRASQGYLTEAWVRYTVDLDQAVRAAGIDYNRTFRLRFARYGRKASFDGGIAIDGIEVSSHPSPLGIQLSLPPELREGGAPGIGTVSLPFAALTDTLISLTSSAPAELILPAQVVIPQGGRSASFQATVAGDLFLEETKTVLVSASSPYLPNGVSAIRLVDGDFTDFSFTVPTTEVVEGNRPIEGTVSIPHPAASPISFSVSATGTGAVIPAATTATIYPGKTSAPVWITIVNDSAVDGPQTGVITVSRNGIARQSPVITVADNESRALSLRLASSTTPVQEGKTFNVTAELPGTLPNATELTFTSSRPDLVAPPSVQSIAAGSRTLQVPVATVEDSIPRNVTAVSLTVSTPGFESATLTLNVRDNDPASFAISSIPSPQARGADIPITITARAPDGSPQLSFAGNVTLSTVPRSDIESGLSGAFFNGAWHGSIKVRTDGVGYVLNAYGPNGSTGSTGPFDVGPGTHAAMKWDPVPSTLVPGTPAAIGVQAVDSGGNPVSISDPIAIRLMAPAPGASIAQSTSSTSSTFPASARQARMQFLLFASELGGPSALAGMNWFVSSNARGQTLTNFTVRIKATSKASLSAADGWDNAGWTTVHRENRSVQNLGVFPIPFSQPWYFNGQSNVLIDVSYDNVSANSDSVWWLAKYQYPYRVVGADPSTPSGNPLTWSGITPPLSEEAYFPQVQVEVLQPVPGPFPSTGNLNGGRWEGTFVYPGMINAAYFHASDLGGREGYSNRFSVALPSESIASLPFTEDFESGVLSGAWAISSGATAGRVGVSSLFGPRSGFQHAVLDSPLSNSRRAELTLKLDLFGYSSVSLEFWAKRFGGANDGPPSAPFSTGANFDGVAISGDGVNWYEIQPLRGMTKGTWTKFTVNLDQAIVSRGMTLNQKPPFHIRFNCYAYESAPSDGIAIDDISITGIPTLRPTLTIPAEILEQGGAQLGTLTLPSPASGPITIPLASTVPGILSVPANIAFVAGQTSASFPLTPVYRSGITGPVPVVISAQIGSDPAVRAKTSVSDQEAGALSLSIAPAVTEGDQDVSAILTVSPPPVSTMIVSLNSTLPEFVQVPATVAIGPGQTTVKFPVTIGNDRIFQAPRNVTLRATAPQWQAAETNLELADNDKVILSFLNASVTEGASLNLELTTYNPLSIPTVITLTSSDPSRLSVPATVTTALNSTTVLIPCTVPDNADIEGSVNVTVSATAPGLNGTVKTFAVRDNDVHRFEFDPIYSVVRGVPFKASIRALSLDGLLMTNFTGTPALSAESSIGAHPVTPGATGSFSGGIWTGDVTITSFAESVRLRATHSATVIGESTPFHVGLGSPVSFAWLPISPAQMVGKPFAATITAMDAGNNPVYNHRGYLMLSSPTIERQTGTSTTTTNSYPFGESGYQDQRTQVAYYPNQVGGTGSLNSLALYVTSASSQTRTNWTIRLRHYPVSSGFPTTFVNSGWTTVHRSSPTLSGSGWINFDFTTPFVYDGTSLLLVDFSFDNSVPVSLTSIRTNSPSYGGQTCAYHSAGGHGDPLTWAMSPFLASGAPQLKFNANAQPSTVSPAVILMNGAPWSGMLTMGAVSSNASILAEDGFGVKGASGLFAVAQALDADSDKLPDYWEAANGLSSASAGGADGADGDWDGDGLSNFLEYAMNLNPRRFDLQGMPTSAVVENPADGKDYLELSYRRRMGNSGVNYAIETSSALLAWSPDPANYQQVGLPMPVGDGLTEVVTVRILPAIGTPGSEPRFGRVRMSAP